MLVGISNAGSDTRRTLFFGAVMVVVLAWVARPALVALPWWKATLAVVGSLVAGPLIGIVVIAVVANAVILPFVLRERWAKRRFESLILGMLDEGKGSGAFNEDSVRWALRVKHQFLWKVLHERDDVIRLAVEDGAHRQLALRLLLRHAHGRPEVYRAMYEGRAVLEAGELDAEDARRLGWWLRRHEEEEREDG